MSQQTTDRAEKLITILTFFKVWYLKVGLSVMSVYLEITSVLDN